MQNILRFNITDYLLNYKFVKILNNQSKKFINAPNMQEEEEYFELNELKVGYKLQVKKDMGKGEELIKSEILSIREKDHLEFFVHYINYNKRLDEWTNGYTFVLNTVEVPKKRKKITGKKFKTEKGNQINNNLEEEKQKGALQKHADDSKIKVIDKVHIKDKIIETWYFSPYPEEIQETVYLCSFCLFYLQSKKKLEKHNCNLKHPPGNEIYRENELSFFEIDGHIQKNYCRNLSLLSKLFLDHKTLFYDVDLFMFYVLCRYEHDGFHIVGYFSKEKVTSQGYNLACVLVMPYEQRKGYGKILIDFSYLLSKKENVIASPEKPLSDLGYIGYLSYWKEALEEAMNVDEQGISVEELSAKTAILPEDILTTFNHFRMIKFYEGELIFVKNKFSKPRKHKVNEKYLKWKGHCFNQNLLRLL